MTLPFVRRLTPLCTAVLVSLAAWSGSAASQDDTVTTQATPSPIQVTMLGLINQARAVGRTCGSTYYRAVGPLVFSEKLNTAATLHAIDMARYNYFSHTGRDGSSPWDRFKRVGYSYRYAAENIAAGYSSTSLAVNGWLKSSGHCRNIMNANLKEIGIGYGYSSLSRYKHYWVNDFGTPR